MARFLNSRWPSHARTHDSPKEKGLVHHIFSEPTKISHGWARCQDHLGPKVRLTWHWAIPRRMDLSAVLKKVRMKSRQWYLLRT